MKQQSTPRRVLSSTLRTRYLNRRGGSPQRIGAADAANAQHSPFLCTQARRPGRRDSTNRDSGEPGDGFLQELQPLGAQLWRKAAETGDIPAGARQARDEACRNGIGAV